MKYVFFITVGVGLILSYAFDISVKTANQCKNNPQTCVEVRENAHKLVWD